MPHSSRFEFGPFQLDLNDRLLTRAGEVISLRPKATEILVRLVTNAGQLIKRDVLLKEVWPDTFVEESNLSQTIFTLRKALGDDRSDPRYIETVPRRGYRFVAEVTDEEAKKQQGEAQAASTASVTQHQVVAVLPFLNQTGNPEFDYLADGITHNLINNLSGLPKLRVMSQSAVERYRMGVRDPQKAGQELNANAVLVGRLHSGHIGISVDVELVDPATGWQLWGETFDSERQDRLEIKNEITRQVLAILRLKLIGDDEEKRVTVRYTENTEAYRAYLAGRHHWTSHTRSSLVIAIGHFRQAIALDPNYALAYTAIIDSYLRLITCHPKMNSSGLELRVSINLRSTLPG